MVLDPLETTVVVVAVISGVWLWRQWTAVATKKLNQSLFSRGAHRRGQEATRARLLFASNRTAEEVGQALREGLGVEAGVPAGIRALVLERLYVSRTTPRAIEFTFGSRLHTSFRSMVVLDDRPSGGCEGSYEVRAWEESHGLVNDLEQLQLVQRLVLAELADLGATVAVVAAPERDSVRAAPRKRRLRIPARPLGRRAAPTRLRLGRVRA
ncbi:hypothetical protein ACFFGH_11935 [Lysobacter korlensis]|uniref:DUF2726 domain-containing protein n=1 Tax=Lysobacter korlensis TaxID=553636 RepID=A0ABV6RPN7_9GAMM